MKICWDTLEGLVYIKKRDAWYYKHNRYYYFDECEICKESFFGNSEDSRFCSNSCARRTKQPSKQIILEESNCFECGKKFTRNKSSKIFCSARCFDKNKRKRKSSQDNENILELTRNNPESILKTRDYHMLDEAGKTIIQDELNSLIDIVSFYIPKNITTIKDIETYSFQYLKNMNLKLHHFVYYDYRTRNITFEVKKLHKKEEND